MGPGFVSVGGLMEMTIIDILQSPHIGRMTFEKLRTCLAIRGIKVGRVQLWKELHALETEGWVKIEKLGHGYRINLGPEAARGAST